MRCFGENGYEQSKRKNKNSKNIVYEFADEMTIEVTFEEYLKFNPEKTEADYLELKKWSDEDYMRQNSGENKHSRTSKRLLQTMRDKQSEWKNDEYSEEKYIKKQELVKDAEYILSKLSEKQQRRYLMHYVDGLTTREIAKREGCCHQAVQQNIKAAERKIKTIHEEMFEKRKLEEEWLKWTESIKPALNKLTDVQRRRYLMYHVEGLTILEIAEREGCKYQNVHKSIKEATKKLNISCPEVKV
ncbi:MAG: sigma-70 region 4 domain-containing protein [Defluviitaleaceae bacterium]|nr:sigma-70 region 4 domain-containing protein [Defluviitaleaceae bacterium]